MVYFGVKPIGIRKQIQGRKPNPEVAKNIALMKQGAKKAK